MRSHSGLAAAAVLLAAGPAWRPTLGHFQPANIRNELVASEPAFCATFGARCRRTTVAPASGASTPPTTSIACRRCSSRACGSPVPTGREETWPSCATNAVATWGWARGSSLVPRRIGIAGRHPDPLPSSRGRRERCSDPEIPYISAQGRAPSGADHQRGHVHRNSCARSRIFGWPRCVTSVAMANPPSSSSAAGGTPSSRVEAPHSAPLRPDSCGRWCPGRAWTCPGPA